MAKAKAEIASVREEDHLVESTTPKTTVGQVGDESPDMFMDGPDRFTSPSNVEFPLSKTIISNQEAKEKIIDPFNEITISEEKFNNEKINGIYNDLFYQIPKQGKKSHTTIIEQSTDYVYPEVNINLENSISEKEETLLELNDIYLSGSIPQLNQQHPVYDNGLFIQEGNIIDNAPVDPNSDIWYIQQGFKRKLGRNSSGNVGGYWHRLLRQAKGEEVYNSNGQYKALKTSPNFRYLTPEELNNIPNGKDINDGGDLNIKKITDIGDDFTYSEIKIKLSCKGVEKFHKFAYGEPGYDYNLSGYPETGGYWWLDTEGYCKVKTQRDIDPYNDFEPTTSYTLIKGGTSKTITISRDTTFYTNNFINGTNDPLNPEFYNPNASVGINEETRQEGGGNLPTMGVWKWWGEGKLFPSIIDVEPGSRLNYRLESPYNSEGNIVDGGDECPAGGCSHRLYGIIDSDGAVVQGYPEQENVFIDLYNKDSNHGTKMINKSCYGPLGDNCYGALGQSNDLQIIFNDPDSNYYQKYINNTYKCYGQPILKVNDKYAIFMQRWKAQSGVDWNAFYNLEDGNTQYVKNKNLDDEVDGYVRDSKKWFNWTKSDGKLNNPKLYYPGLMGDKINIMGTEYDRLSKVTFNPDPADFASGYEYGSNFYKTQWMEDNLDLA